MAGERFLDPRRPPRDQALARDEPAGEQQQAEHARARPAKAGRAPRVGREGSRLALRERPEPGGDEEAAARHNPRRQGGCAGCARPDQAERAAAGSGRRDRWRRSRTASSAVRSTSPIAQPRTNRVAEVDVARRSLRELEAGVERPEQVLGGPAELAQARGVERVVRERLRRRVRRRSSASAPGSRGRQTAPARRSVNGSRGRPAGGARTARRLAAGLLERRERAAVRTSAAAGERAVSPAISEPRAAAARRARRG